MRSFNNFQTNQNPSPLFAIPNPDIRLPSLVSQYMDMFDPSKVNVSLLQKRDRSTVDNFHQNELQKKLKIPIGLKDDKSLTTMPNFSAMMFNPNIPQFHDIPVKTEAVNDFDIRNLRQLQNSNLALSMMQQQEALHILQSRLDKKLQADVTHNKTQKTTRAKPEEVCVKEEYVKQEEVPAQKASPVASHKKSKKACDMMSENNTTNDTLSEASIGKNDFLIPSPVGDEPVLIAYTRAFPEWDLATIFSFIKSGKSVDAFEKEKKFRMERKMKKSKTEPKKVVDIKPKQNKTKKMI